MNKKKFILPIAVAALGFTACNKGLNVDVAAERAVDSLIATCKKLDTFGVNVGLEISKADLGVSLSGITPPGSSADADISVTSNLKMENFGVNADVNVHNLKYYTLDESDNPSNKGLQVAAKVDDLKGKFDLDLGVNGKKTLLNVNDLTDLGKLDVRAYLANSYDGTQLPSGARPVVYGCFFDWGDSYRLLTNLKNKIKADGDDQTIAEAIKAMLQSLLIDQLDPNIADPESCIQKCKTNMGDKKTTDPETGEPTTIEDHNYLGSIASTIEEISGLDAEDKKEERAKYISSVKEFLEEPAKTPEIGQIISMSTSGDKTTFTMDLSWEKINTIINMQSKENEDTKYFTNGNIKVTLASDDNKHISNFKIEANSLKTDEITLPMLSSFKFKLNDLSLKLEANVDYDIDVREAFKDVPDTVTALEYNELESKKSSDNVVSIDTVSVACLAE